MIHTPTVDILLSTYNGERYIEAQINSLLRQTFTDWRLYLRDDGSSDKTMSFLLNYALQLGNRCHIIEHPKINLGACQSFMVLLEYSDSDYVMFCDQDDIWLPNKISVTVDKMRFLENKYGENTPILVHTDAKVVDSNLKEINPSLWNYQKSNPVKGSKLKRLLLQNTVTGCTMMVNRSLRTLALPIPHEAIMHDWWLALVAATFGRIELISEPTVLYRQHDKNYVGAEKWSSLVAGLQLLDLLHPKKMQQNKRRSMALLYNQANAMLKQYKDLMNLKDHKMVQAYSHLSEIGYIARRYYIFKYGFFYSDFLRNLGMLFFR